jgi:hypothetical protein
LRVTWRDGSTGTVDMTDPIHCLKVFGPLREGGLFDLVRTADYGWAIAWTDDIDFSADSLWRLAEEQAGRAMSAKQFREWRTANTLSQAATAEVLGLSPRMVKYYESGEKPIPRTVYLACKGADIELRERA